MKKLLILAAALVLAAACNNGSKYTVRGTIRDMEKLLSGSFIRCNNSYIVNLRHIESVEDNLIVIHGNKIPITRSRKNDFYKAFNAYNGVL